jgi:hypothetical protein
MCGCMDVDKSKKLTEMTNSFFLLQPSHLCSNPYWQCS